MRSEVLDLFYGDQRLSNRFFADPESHGWDALAWDVFGIG